MLANVDNPVHAESQPLPREEPTEDDIRLFRKSLAARRFPGIQAMSDEEVRSLIRSSRSAMPLKSPLTEFRSSLYRDRGRTTTRASSSSSAMHANEGGMASTSRNVDKTGTNLTKIRPAFRPVNPHSAKDTVSRKPEELYLNKGIPYDRVDRAFTADKVSDERRKVSGAFVPNSSMRRAQVATTVEYYLYSATQEVKEQEQQQLMGRTLRNAQKLHEEYLGAVRSAEPKSRGAVATSK